MVELAARRLRAVESELRRNDDEDDVEAAALAARGAAMLERCGRYLERNDARVRSFWTALTALALGFASARIVRSLITRRSARSTEPPQVAAGDGSAFTPALAPELESSGRNLNGTVGVQHGP